MFWSNFIDCCNKKGVSPNVAAAAVGIKSSGSVTGWKNGAIPRQSVINRLADYFGVDVNDLVRDDGPDAGESAFFDQFDMLSRKCGKTPNGVAKELNIPSSSVTQWRHGVTPRPQTLQLISNYFGVSVEYLLTGAGPGDIKKERPAENGEALEKDLPEDIQQLLSICRQNPALASALLSVARQIEKGQAGPGSGGRE